VLQFAVDGVGGRLGRREPIDLRENQLTIDQLGQNRADRVAGVPYARQPEIARRSHIRQRDQLARGDREDPIDRFGGG